MSARANGHPDMAAQRALVAGEWAWGSPRIYGLRPDQLPRVRWPRVLPRGASDWLIGGAGGPGPSLCHGLAGVVLALHEAGQHFGDEGRRTGCG